MQRGMFPSPFSPYLYEHPILLAVPITMDIMPIATPVALIAANVFPVVVDVFLVAANVFAVFVQVILVAAKVFLIFVDVMLVHWRFICGIIVPLTNKKSTYYKNYLPSQSSAASSYWKYHSIGNRLTASSR